MPVRRRNLRQRTTLRLHDLPFEAHLHFSVGWKTPEESWADVVSQCPTWDVPGARENWIAMRLREFQWATREEFLSDYDAVRDELIAGRERGDFWGREIAEYAAEKQWREWRDQ